MSKKRIEPVYRKCKCGRRVIHHHLECDKCNKIKKMLNKPKEII